MRFAVPDMSCNHCSTAIQTAIARAGGRASVDLDARTVTVEGLDATRAAEAIRAAGYETAPA